MELMIAILVALFLVAAAAWAIALRARAEARAARAEADEALGRLAASREEARRTAAAIGLEAEGVAHGSRELAGRNDAQASAITQAAASMEQLSASVRRNTESARATQEIVARAGEATTQAIEAATSVMARMESVREATTKASDIVGLIDGIAFQTNILALNAAVEAARAGEHGRGFAVVAAEVRALSQRAAASAHEIKALTASAAAQVTESSAGVDQVAEAIAAINGRIAEVNELMNSVVAAGNQQLGGIGQAGRSVQEMEGITQRNAALAAQSLRAIEALASRAAQLSAAFEDGGAARPATPRRVETPAPAVDGLVPPRAVALPWRRLETK